MDNNVFSHVIPLISAEGEMRVSTVRNMGRKCDVVIEFGNRILIGNVSGFLYRCRIPWRRAIEWAEVMGGKHSLGGSVATRLRDGRGAVLGQRYGPVNMEINPMAQLVLFLTPEDCETIAHVVTEAVAEGTGRAEFKKRLY